MNISILTLFPSLYTSFLQTSLVARAQEQERVKIVVEDIFKVCAPKERVDAPTFGHGTGMLIKPLVIEKAVQQQEKKYGSSLKIFFSPHGKKLNQDLLKDLYERWSQHGHLMLIPARYEGMDARVEEEYADEIISIGDYVLMGGDLPAMVFLEGLLRLVPEVVGKSASVEHESFSGSFVDYPSYTEPVEWQGRVVPEVVRSGNHKALAEWRQAQAAQRTVLHHFEWLREHVTKEDIQVAAPYIPPHYVALMHTDVLLPDGRTGETSVTSLDMHDIARSARTYGLKGYAIVTPLVDQQRIVQRLLSFWQEGAGIEYNPHRHEAVNAVVCTSSLEEVLQMIEAKEGKPPVIVATSARAVDHPHIIAYSDQEQVWSHNRPVLFLLGTGQGLAPHRVDQADFLLLPLKGFSAYNHLSVRSAAAIIFDRWLGITTKIKK